MLLCASPSALSIPRLEQRRQLWAQAGPTELHVQLMALAGVVVLAGGRGAPPRADEALASAKPEVGNVSFNLGGSKLCTVLVTGIDGA